MAPFCLFIISALVVGTLSLTTAISSSSRKLKQPQHAFDSLKHDMSRGYQCFDDAHIDLSPETWQSFHHLWRINEATVLSRNGGDTYITHYIHEAIVQVADETVVDARLILVLMMQEVSIVVNRYMPSLAS